MRATAFRSSSRKDTVRNLWCTPLLQALSAAIRSRYFYLGFPGPRASDVREWRQLDLLGRVCAFEMASTDSDDELEWLTQLEESLAGILIPHNIPFDTHFGLLEQVMMRDVDLNGKAFVQNSLVTLYQLDFCHALTDASSPVFRLNLRYEAIRQLFIHQARQLAEEKTRPFVIFLTVRDEIDTGSVDDLRGWVAGSADQPIVDDILSEMPLRQGDWKHPCHPILKPFVFHILNGYLHGLNIRALFLPPIYYVGNDRDDHMVLFSALGTFDYMSSGEPRVLQRLQEFQSVQGLELAGRDLRPLKRCRAETIRYSRSNALAEYVDTFRKDPIWESVAREARGV